MTYISWSSDFALYLWLYLIDKHDALGTCSASHYISWSSDFALYLGPYQIGGHHTLDTCSVWHCQRPHTICNSVWPIFHGQVIFSLYILLYLIDKRDTLITCSVSHWTDRYSYLKDPCPSSEAVLSLVYTVCPLTHVVPYLFSYKAGFFFSKTISKI